MSQMNYTASWTDDLHSLVDAVLVSEASHSQFPVHAARLNSPVIHTLCATAKETVSVKATATIPSSLAVTDTDIQKYLGLVYKLSSPPPLDATTAREAYAFHRLADFLGDVTMMVAVERIIEKLLKRAWARIPKHDDFRMSDYQQFQEMKDTALEFFQHGLNMPATTRKQLCGTSETYLRTLMDSTTSKPLLYSIFNESQRIAQSPAARYLDMSARALGIIPIVYENPSIIYEAQIEETFVPENAEDETNWFSELGYQDGIGIGLHISHEKLETNNWIVSVDIGVSYILNGDFKLDIQFETFSTSVDYKPLKGQFEWWTTQDAPCTPPLFSCLVNDAVMRTMGIKVKVVATKFT